MASVGFEVFVHAIPAESCRLALLRDSAPAGGKAIQVPDIVQAPDDEAAVFGSDGGEARVKRIEDEVAVEAERQADERLDEARV